MLKRIIVSIPTHAGLGDPTQCDSNNLPVVVTWQQLYCQGSWYLCPTKSTFLVYDSLMLGCDWQLVILNKVIDFSCVSASMCVSPVTGVWFNVLW